VSKSEKLSSDLAAEAQFDEMTQQPANELVEVETAKLEQVAGGPDGTVLGLA
jgi:hypothetical protein